MKFHKIRVRPGPAIAISFLLILLSLFLQPVSADEVLINDGSRIMGEVMRHDTAVLKIKTSFAGTLEIDWSEVVEVKLTDRARHRVVQGWPYVGNQRPVA